jgi:hypothetical protein
MEVASGEAEKGKREHGERGTSPEDLQSENPNPTQARFSAAMAPHLILDAIIRALLMNAY